MTDPGTLFDRPAGSLRRSVGLGAAATGAAQAVEIGVQVLSVLVLSRLLSPGDFGLIAMCAPILAFVGLIRSFGLTQATVQRRTITAAEVNFLFWINVGASLALGLLLVLISPLVAAFYDEPRVGPLMAAMSLTLVASSLSAQHFALLTRAMRFGRIALISSVNVVATFLVAVAWALVSPSYWAIFVGTLVGAVLSTIYAWASSGWWPSRPGRVGTQGELLRFGGGITGFNLSNFFARNLDNVLIGRSWGGVELGYYDRAYKLLLFPLSRISNPLSRVMIPALSGLTDEPHRYRHAYMRVLNLTLIVILPGVAWATAMAQDLFPFLLGDGWGPSAHIFMALGFAGMVQPLNNPSGWLFISQGRSTHYMYWGFASAAIAVAAFAIGLPWGAFGVAVAYAVSEYLKTVPLWLLIGRAGPVGAADIARSSGPLVLAAHIALVAVWFAQGAVEAAPVVRLGAMLVLSYAVALAVAVLTRAGRATLKEGWRMLPGRR